MTEPESREIVLLLLVTAKVYSGQRAQSPCFPHEGHPMNKYGYTIAAFVMTLVCMFMQSVLNLFTNIPMFEIIQTYCLVIITLKYLDTD